jgi:hypothetical protein
MKADKKWATPELIILVRNRLEEAVLTPCKAVKLMGLGPGVADENCQTTVWGSCGRCKWSGSS